MLRRVPSLLLLSALACGESAGTSETLAARIEASGFQGVALVQRGDEVLLQDSYGLADLSSGRSLDMHTRFRIGSMTKAFTALLIVQLVEEGLLAFDMPVSDLFPDYPRGDAITLHHLLSHASGLPDYLGVVDETESYDPEELVGAVMDAPLNFDPGTAFEYSNTNYAALGVIIEAVTGQTWAEALSDRILLPYGLSATEVGSDPIVGESYARGYAGGEPARAIDMSVPYAAGALSSSASDMLRWAQLWMSGALVSEASAERIFPATPAPDVNAVGYGWFVVDDGGVRMRHHGGDISGFTSFLGMVPDQAGVILLLSNQENQGALRNELVGLILDEVFRN